MKTATVRTVIESLPVPLTKEELVAMGDEVVAKLDAIDRIDEELKERRDAAKDQKEEIQERLAHLRDCIRSGTEYRSVRCYEVARYDAGVAEVVREDTQAVVRTRMLEPRERQQTLDQLLEPAETEHLAELERKGEEIIARMAAASTPDLQQAAELAERIAAGGPLVQAVAQKYLDDHAPAPAPSSAPTPLDVDCARCGVVAGEPCRSLTRGKGQGKPLAEGVFHDERIAALAPAEPTSESWGDEIEDGEEVG